MRGVSAAFGNHLGKRRAHPDARAVTPLIRQAPPATFSLKGRRK